MKKKEKKQNKLFGCQTPTWSWCAKYKETFANLIIDLFESYGWNILEWEKFYISNALAVDDYNEFLNMINVLIVPRQNGKTLCIILIIAFYLVLYPTCANSRSVSILYTAHNVSTNQETFNDLCNLFDNKDDYPDLYKLTHWGGQRSNGIGKANGKEKIECRWKENGKQFKTVVKFNARSKSNARGVSLNAIVVDEAQELTSQQSAAMLPTGAASKTKTQVYYLGTPIYPGCPGDIFKELREKIKEKKPAGNMLMEWATNEIGDVTDKKRWARLNPSFNYFLREDYIEKVELVALPDDQFARERLGYWQDKQELLDLPINEKDWEETGTNKPLVGGITCYGVKFDISSRTAAVVACIKKKEEFYLELVQLFNCYNGLNELVEFLSKIGKKAAQIIIDGYNTSYDLKQRLLNYDIPNSAIIITKPYDLTCACAMMEKAVVSHEVSHYAPQEQLNKSATLCTRRIIGSKGGWGFEDRNDGYAFIIECAALSYFAARTTKRNPNRTGSIGYF